MDLVGTTVTELTGNQGRAVLTMVLWQVTGADGLFLGGTGVEVALTVTVLTGNSASETAFEAVEDNILKHW